MRSIERVRLVAVDCDGNARRGGLKFSLPGTGVQTHHPQKSYALRWTIMERLRGTAALWLDLGGTESDQGLKHFKLGNVGKRGRVVAIPGEFDFIPNVLAGGAAKAIMLGKEMLHFRQLKQLAGMLPI